MEFPSYAAVVRATHKLILDYAGYTGVRGELLSEVRKGGNHTVCAGLEEVVEEGGNEVLLEGGR